jgi:hypothetical protein
MQPTSSQKSSKTACQPGGIHISAALGAMRRPIKRSIFQGASKQGVRVGAAPPVSPAAEAGPMRQPLPWPLYD